jgi:hypothetical protein
VRAGRRVTTRAVGDGAARAIAARRSGAHSDAKRSARSACGVPTGRAPCGGAGTASAAASSAELWCRVVPVAPVLPQAARTAVAAAAPRTAVSR